ncbi:hypothetical protein CDAR_315691 [Caerostris darwini]|uniref:Uncharacterized protein n=1 Tax=Caerostris darwini TaxID=1538125 RepID=A0AAV4PWA8_9ARAC|nr:hypothetical protein CDAR_315691 [Caerostris darwini]
MSSAQKSVEKCSVFELVQKTQDRSEAGKLFKSCPECRYTPLSCLALTHADRSDTWRMGGTGANVLFQQIGGGILPNVVHLGELAIYLNPFKTGVANFQYYNL